MHNHLQTRAARRSIAYALLVVLLGVSVSAQHTRKVVRQAGSAPVTGDEGGGDPDPGGGGPDDISTADIEYQGVCFIGDGGGTDVQYMTSAMGNIAVYRTGGVNHIFITGRSAHVGDGSVQDDLHEFADCSGNGARMALVRNWGNPIVGAPRTVSVVNAVDVYGIQIDPNDAENTADTVAMYVGYGETYTTNNSPSRIKSRLDFSTHTISSWGPYYQNSHSQAVKGYMTTLSARTTTALGSGYRFATGMGPSAQLTDYGYGVYLEAFKTQADGEAGEAYLSSAKKAGGSVLIRHYGPQSCGLGCTDVSGMMDRPDTVDRSGWTYYGDASGYASGSSHQPQENPVQDGSGCNDIGDKCGSYLNPADAPAGKWTDLDAVWGVVYAEGTARKGYIAFGQIADALPLAERSQTYPVNGRPHFWYSGDQICSLVPFPTGCNTFYDPFGYRDFGYGTSTGPHTMDMRNVLWLYSEGDVYSVATGGLSNLAITPYVDAYDLNSLPRASGVPAFSMRTAGYYQGRMAYEPVSRTLYVTDTGTIEAQTPYVQVLRVHKFHLNIDN
jgi:hypothetical protein